MYKKKEIPIKQIIIVICLLFTLAALLFLLRHRVIPNSDQVNDLRYARLLNIIDHLERLIEKNPPASEAREDLEFRKEYYEWQVTQLAKPTEPQRVMLPRKQTSIALATKTALLYTPMPTATRLLGILAQPDYVRHISQEAKIANLFWVGKVGEAYAKIYSGSLRDDPDRSVIYVFLDQVGNWLKFLSPQKLGSIEIVAYKGNILTFSNTKGEQIYFDVARLQFTNSSVEQLSTATIDFRAYETPYPGP